MPGARSCPRAGPRRPGRRRACPRRAGRRARPRGRTTRTRWPLRQRRPATGAPATTGTCSTPAAPPAAQRASCGATRTSSSPRSAAATPAVSGRRPGGGARRTPAPAGPAASPPRRSPTAPRSGSRWPRCSDGGTVVVTDRPDARARAPVGPVPTREVSILVIVGDAFARPLADALAAEPDRWDLDGCSWSSPAARVLSPAVREELLAPPAVDRRWSTATARPRPAARARCRSGRARPSTALPRFHVDDRHRRARRRGPPGCAGQRAGRPAGPPRAHPDRLPRRRRADAPRRSRSIDGERWAIPGDLGHRRGGRLDHPARPGRELDQHAAARRCSPKRSRPCSSPTPTCSTPSWSACPTTAGASGSSARRAAPRRVGDRRDDLDAHCRAQLADFKVPRQVVLVDAVAAAHRQGRPRGGPDRAVVGPAAADEPSVLTAPSGYRSRARWSSTSPSPRSRRRAPTPTARRSSGGDRRLTYAELAERTRRLANVLRDAGLGVHRERRELAGHESGQDHLGALPLQRQRVPRGDARRVQGPGRAVQRQLPLRRRGAALPAQRRAGARASCTTRAFAPTLAEVLPDLPDLERADPGRRRLRQRAAPAARSTTRTLLAGVVRRAARRRRPGRPTTSTSSTPAAPPACPRACCGASTTSSSAPWAAGPSAAGRGVRRPRRVVVERRGAAAAR